MSFAVRRLGLLRWNRNWSMKERFGWSIRDQAATLGTWFGLFLFAAREPEEPGGSVPALT
jgi:hypothetical protein